MNIQNLGENRNVPRRRVRRHDRLRRAALDTFSHIAEDRHYISSISEHTHYEFTWPNEEYRDQILWFLCKGGKRQSLYPAERLLRKLMYRFRGASHRRNRSLGAEFDCYSWVWRTNAEMSAITGLSTDQIRRAGRYLVDCGLIVKFTHHDLAYVPHYRPTTDLVKVCHHLCYLYDRNARQQDSARDPRGTATSRFHEHLGKRICTHHMDLVEALVTEFVCSDDPDRVENFREKYQELWLVAAGSLDASAI